ncbi:MAG: DUF523 domain-containing protein [Negativicutes bacterium]
MILVSACLAGVECRYNGTAFPCDGMAELVSSGKAIVVCPEVLGGLVVPRLPAEIVGLRVRTTRGQDVTDAYQTGAATAFRIAVENGCKIAVLKARSPSCGSGRIYDGSFSGRLIDGDGLLASLLKQAGIAVYTEEEYAVRIEKSGGEFE